MVEEAYLCSRKVGLFKRCLDWIIGFSILCLCIYAISAVIKNSIFDHLTQRIYIKLLRGNVTQQYYGASKL